MTYLRHNSRRVALCRLPAGNVVWGVLLTMALLLCGCGYSGQAVSANGVMALGGAVNGGDQPVSGASIQLYAAGSSGVASAAQPLLSTPVQTDSSGKFSIAESYNCPSPSTLVYVVARGGNPGLAGGASNAALTLTAMAGTCSALSSAPLVVNEVTTVGTVWPLAQYMASATNVGAAANDAGFAAAVASVPEFINSAKGISPGTPAANSYFAESAKLYSLADVLAGCVNSAGGKAGDGSACGSLFALATPAGGAAPTDTMTAAIHIAQNPDNGVNGIFGLVGGDASFTPTVATAPTDWTLTLSYLVATPVISLATGTYNGAQTVTIADATAGSAIYYTTDGTAPSSASTLYSGAIAVSSTTTLQAIAVLKGSLSAAASATLTIAPPAVPVGPGAPTPAMLGFVQQPSNGATLANLSPAVAVAIEDASGNVVTNASNAVTIALPGGSGLGGTVTANAVQGIATFDNLTISQAGAYTLLAASANLIPATSNSFTVTAPTPTATAARLAFVQQPTGAQTLALIAPAVQVAVEDANGNVVTDASAAVTLTLSGNSALGGTLTASPQNGIATFSNLSIGSAGTYTVTAMSATLTPATSAAFTITAPNTTPAAVRLAYLQQPSNALSGQTIAPAVRVAVEDSNGNIVTTATNAVTLALPGSSSLTGTLTVNATGGIATFSNLAVANVGTYSLLAASTSLLPASSSTFAISAPVTAPTAAKLAFVQQPSTTVAGVVMTPAVTVAVEDSNGNIVSNAGNAVTLALNSGSGLGGTLTVSPVNGIATFSTLTESNAGSYALAATSAGLAGAASAGFTITAPVAAPTAVKLAFVQQPSNAVAGALLAPAITVAVQDSNGNTVATANNAVTLALLSGSGLGGTLTVNAHNGIATFSTLEESVAGSYTLAATSAGLSGTTSAGFTISAPVVTPTAVKLAFVQQPSNAVAGALITPAITVAVQDSNGNTMTAANNAVTLALVSGSGLGGTLTVNAQNGIATFSTVAESIAGSYQLAASSSGLAGATSAGFTISSAIVAPTAVKLAFVQQPASGVTGAVLAPAVTVAVEDTNGNTITTASNAVTLSLASGSGLSGTLTVNAQNGIATFSTLVESVAGSYTLAASSAGLSGATSAGFTISAPVVTGTTYYLSPTGSDANNGLSPSAAWLSPNHSLNCGDVISAAAGSYSNANFYTGRWGTVNCPAGNNVAWLRCATFDTCKIAGTSNQGMWVDKSYWGVEGWEITTSASDLYGTCFIAQPNYATPVEIHHIIFANDIANGCSQSGFAVVNHGAVSVDYFAVVGSVAYNASQGSGTCASGISVYQPVQSDSVAGTHIYIAGNVSYGNLEPSICNGTSPTDGEGIILDTFDGSQGGLPTPYAAQAVVENNLVFNNGGKGIEVFNNSAGSAHAKIYIEQNTSWANLTDPNQHWIGCGEVVVTVASDTQVSGNLISTQSATGCGGHAIYALSVEQGDVSDTVNNNFAAGLGGNNTFLYASGSFAYGAQNVLGGTVNFADAVAAGAPNCQGVGNVPSCMAPIINNFAPTATAAAGFGLQKPLSSPTTDALFPKWLCTANLPSGLVTMGCD